MDRETLTLEKIHRQKRSESATEGDAKRLVEVEAAAVAANEAARVPDQPIRTRVLRVRELNRPFEMELPECLRLTLQLDQLRHMLGILPRRNLC